MVSILFQYRLYSEIKLLVVSYSRSKAKKIDKMSWLLFIKTIQHHVQYDQL